MLQRVKGRGKFGTSQLLSVLDDRSRKNPTLKPGLIIMNWISIALGILLQ
ncbi:hypothetical protein S1OALGB6SA_1160 [Olavius algarvensis spirochete endosymbiont]|nr:MAG: hypothetical protein [Olavius algarvensis spirochete endosymbiont]VDB00086.1 hypothetical protein S1OALGB6SA_1160 [Olavius algarvensis spirochete endosymbiont]